MRRKSAGFTLIEVMVALFIVGVSLPAMVTRMSSIIDHTISIEEKTYAYWIADNKLQEFLITQQLEQSLNSTSREKDTIEYGGREWVWQSEVVVTAVPEIFRLNVTVGLTEDESLANLSGFIYKRANNP